MVQNQVFTDFKTVNTGRNYDVFAIYAFRSIIVMLRMLTATKKKEKKENRIG